MATMRLNWVGPLLLCREELERIPLCISGVYLLHATAPALGGYATFYAGKTEDLRRRLLQHVGPRSTKASIRAAQEIDATYWSAAPVEDADFLGPIESGLIRLLNPVCNGQVPVATPVYVNLPPLSFKTFLNEETPTYVH